MTMPEAARPATYRWAHSYVPLAVFLLALLPRLHDLGLRPFWFDEVMTVTRSRLPLAGLVADALHQHHSPLYFLLAAPFDHSQYPEFWLRVPSVIFGALSVMLVFLNASRVAGLGAGVAAALILGLAPTEIAYSQEARSYAMEMFCILLALHGLLGLILSEARAGLPWRDPGAPVADWVQFIIGSAAAFCTLGNSLPWLLAADATAVLLIWRARERGGMARNFLIANVFALAPCLPIYAAIAYLRSKAFSMSFTFVPEPTPSLIWFEIQSIYLMRVADVSSFHLMKVPTPQAVTLGISIGLAAAIAASLWHLRHKPAILASLLFALLALPLCLAFISVWYPVLMVRYLLWSGSIFAILAGIGVQAGLENLPRPMRPILLFSGAVLVLINLAPFYNVETKPRWDIAAKIIAAQARPDAVFYLFERSSGHTLNYYLPLRLQNILSVDAGATLEDVVQAHRNGRQIWVIYGDSAQRTGWVPRAEFLARLAPLGTPGSEQYAGARITIWCYAAGADKCP